MSICNCPFSLLIFCSAAVFLIVGGQSTTDDDYNKMDQLMYTVAKLEGELTTLTAELAKVKAELAKSVDKIETLEAKQFPSAVDNRKFLLT